MDVPVRGRPGDAVPADDPAVSVASRLDGRRVGVRQVDASDEALDAGWVDAPRDDLDPLLRVQQVAIADGPVGVDRRLLRDAGLLEVAPHVEQRRLWRRPGRQSAPSTPRAAAPAAI